MYEEKAEYWFIGDVNFSWLYRVAFVTYPSSKICNTSLAKARKLIDMFIALVLFDNHLGRP